MALSKRNLMLYRIYALALLLFLGLSAALVFLPRPSVPTETEHQDYLSSRDGNPVSQEPVPLPPSPGEAPVAGPEALPSAGISGSGEDPVPKPLPPRRKMLYFVIDDAGYSLEQLQAFLDFPGKITMAVIPFLPFSKESSRRTLEAGKSLILHMPMEALKEKAGGGAIMAGDRGDAIVRKLDEALRNVPGVSGVNNHMGSKATADLEVMKEVLKHLKTKGLFFLDSHTNPGSMARTAGKDLGITVWERNVFLDNEKNRDYILQAIEEGKKIADKKGHAVMIGHVWTSELAEVLTEIYPQLLDQGYTLEDLSHLFTLTEDDDGTGY